MNQFFAQVQKYFKIINNSDIIGYCKNLLEITLFTSLERTPKTSESHLIPSRSTCAARFDICKIKVRFNENLSANRFLLTMFAKCQR